MDKKSPQSTPAPATPNTKPNEKETLKAPEMKEQKESKETNKKTRESFISLYKKLKECSDIPLSPTYFIQNAKIFSIPILYRFLLTFTFIKFGLTLLYFIFWEDTFINFPILVHFLMLVCSSILLFMDRLIKYKPFFFLNILSQYYTKRVFHVIYIISFIFIDNYLCYYYPNYSFSLNPGIPIFIFLGIIFFESQHFNDGLLYIYILNFLCFLYFFSLHSCLNVYLPINIDIGIYILIIVIAHNIGRKLFISEMFFKFYEKVLEILNNELGIVLIFEGGAVYPKKDDENKENKGKSSNKKESFEGKKRKNSLRVIDDLIIGDETSNEGDYISSFSALDKNVEKFSVPDFEGFEVCIPNNREISNY